MSLLDVANMFNLDGYWLGAPVAGMTYRTAGPQYQQILRTSLEPVLADFEDVWSYAFLPRGQVIRFQRSQLLREDLATSTAAATSLYNAGLITMAEARVMVGLPPDTLGAVGTGADIGPAPTRRPQRGRPIYDRRQSGRHGGRGRMTTTTITAPEARTYAATLDLRRSRSDGLRLPRGVGRPVRHMGRRGLVH